MEILIKTHYLLINNRIKKMKTKHLFYTLALSAAFAACSQEEIVSQQGAIKTDLEERPVVGNVTLDLGDAESRGTTGVRGFNDIAFVKGEDGFGARVIDVYSPYTVPAGYTLDHASRNYKIENSFASSNYKYVNNGGASWITDALMVEGNYLFYYPYNEANLARTPNKVVLPMTQVVKPNETDGYRNPIKDLYEGENPAIVGYAFLSATDQDATVKPTLNHIFAYPQFTLVNNLYEKPDANGQPIGLDMTIEKILVKSSNFVKNYTVSHEGIKSSLRNFGLSAQKYTGTTTNWAEAEAAGTWIKKADLLKSGKTSDIVDANTNASVDGTIEVLFDGGLKLAYGEEYTFNLVMPAATYNDATDLTFIVYLSDDKMLTNEYTVDANNYDVLTYAPSFRYPTEEYNFPTNGEPAAKQSAGALGTITFDLDVIKSAVAPAQLIDDAAEFEEFLKGIKDNAYIATEVASVKDIKKSWEFALADSDENGVADMKIDAAVVELVKKYLSKGGVKFLSTVEVADTEETVVLNQMEFNNVCFKAGNVTVQNMKAVASEICGDATVSVEEVEGATIAMGNVTVKDGELVIKKDGFMNLNGGHKVTVTKTLNEAKTQVIATGKLTIDADNNNFNGLTMDAGEVVINEDAVALIGSSANANVDKGIIAGTITVDGKLQVWSEYVVAKDVTLNLNGAVEYVNTGAISNEGTINTEISLDVNSNKGTIKPGASTIKVTVLEGTGKINNTNLAKVNANSGQTVYAEVSRFAGLKAIDAVSGVNKIVVTGDWTISSSWDCTLEGQNASVKFATIEFNGGDLNVASGVTFDMNGAAVIINADTEWTGRDANASYIVGIKGDITVNVDTTDNLEYDFNVVDLTIADQVLTPANQTEFVNAINNASAGSVIALNGELKLTSGLTINKDITIKAGTISGKPVSVGTAVDVTFEGVTFANATTGTESSIYASNHEGDITIKNCKFEGFQWEAIQITPAVSAGNIEISGCEFNATSAHRYLHIQADKTNGTNAKITIVNNKFGSSANVANSMIDVDYIRSWGQVTAGGNTFADSKESIVNAQDIYVIGSETSAGKHNVYDFGKAYDAFTASTAAVLK